MNVSIKILSLLLLLVTFSCIQRKEQNDQLGQKIISYSKKVKGVHDGVLQDFISCANKAKYNLGIVDRAAEMAYTLGHSTQSLLFIAEEASSAKKEVPELNLAIDVIVMKVSDGEIRDIVTSYIDGEISYSDYKETIDDKLAKSSYKTLEEAIRKNLI